MDSSGKHAYQIGGVKVEFPYKAYGPQLAFMGKVITTLERAFRDPDSHCNALLESPTGSGKSLALLCSALAWQDHRKNFVPAPPSGPAHLVGGGFIPEDPVPEAEDSKSQAKKKKPPTIFYATRTHSQIAQIIKELRKTSYRVPMAILAARKHYCTNQYVCKKTNLDDECKILLKDPNKACQQFKNVQKLKNHVSLQKGGCHETHDIEDLVKLAHVVKGCAYFSSRAMAVDASIVFCPYSYILNPIIRKAMEVDVRGAIIIFDEAHNIEDISREAGSIDLETSFLEELRNELEQLSSSEESSDFYQPLLELIQELLIWISQKQTSLSKREAGHFCASWTGLKATGELQGAGISVESFSILQECASKACAAASDPDPESKHLSGRPASTLEGLFSVLRFMLSKPEHIHDYQLVLQKVLKKDYVSGTDDWTYSISFWCLNPGVVFDEIAKASKSVILTSGTLSPMGSFASELGASFEISMEAPHIINMSSQILVSTISVGPGEVALNASYQHADTTTFQDALGVALEQLFKVVPDGALVFFPSYKLLQKVCTRWKSTGHWKRISEIKKLFVETRGAPEEFEDVLKGYYKAIKKEAEAGVQKQTKRSNFQRPNSSKGNGAAFLAVCRGKVSEGINFADENARAVVVVGIPFPNLKDVQVNMKKKYNDGQKAKQLLGGDQWYSYQAFRALNQAVGRCIRHREDYGAILLLDERFNRPSYVGFMSKWLRNSITKPRSFEAALTDLQSFFCKFKDGKSSEERSSLSINRWEVASAEELPSTPCPATQSFNRIISEPEPEPAPETSAMDIDSQLQTEVEEEANSTEMKCFLFCSCCGNHLGVSEHINIPCRKEILQKSYLRSLGSITSSSFPALVVEDKLMSPILFNNPREEAFRQTHGLISGMWVEDDGLVYKPLVCSWCSDRFVVLGARVLATDPGNMQYSGKAIFLLNSVRARTCFSSSEGCCVATPKRTSLTPGKGKLKLRRKEL